MTRLAVALLRPFPDRTQLFGHVERLPPVAMSDFVSLVHQRPEGKSAQGRQGTKSRLKNRGPHKEGLAHTCPNEPSVSVRVEG